MSFLKKRKAASPCYARMRFGISQQQLADLLGVSRSLVTMMEQKKRKLPHEAKAIYLRLCQKADELPLPANMTIKRGRKPPGSGSNQFFPSFVSNYRMKKFDTKKSWKHRRRLLELQNQPKPSLRTLADQAKKEPGCDAFTAKLKEQKNRLMHFYKLLDFKKEIREQKHIVLSARLAGINKALDYLESLEETWPYSRGKRKIEALIAFNSYKQLKLSEELKKWDVVELLKTEFQMNNIKNRVGLTDEMLAMLENGTQMTRMRQMNADTFLPATRYSLLAS
jgi:transcriptional regulator with XRE-family HTH domain